MVIPLVLGSLLGSAVNAVGSLIGNAQQNNYNQQMAQYNYDMQRQLAEEAYQRDLNMWNKQNAYNAPSAQMDRLRAAGLNPNLVYGNGVTGNNSSAPPRARVPNADLRYQYQSPIAALAPVLSNYFDLKIKQAQYDNLQSIVEQNKVKNGLIGAQTATELERAKKISQDYQSSLFDYELKRELRPYSVDYQKLQNDVLRANLSKIFQDTTTSRYQSQFLQKQIDYYADKIILQQLDLMDRRKGIRSQDHIGWRIGSKLYDQYKDKLPSWLNIF